MSDLENEMPVVQIRKNIASISFEDRVRLRDAMIELNGKIYPGGVSYWFKQAQIYQTTNVRNSPAFLPWHREFLNRYEILLQEVDPTVALHYWDWTTDPRKSPDGNGGFVNLFSTDFMGNSNGFVGLPFSGIFDNNGVYAGSRDQTGNPIDPPQQIARQVQIGIPSISTDLEIINSANHLPVALQWTQFRQVLEGGVHQDTLHAWLGGNIAHSHTAFEDPFVFLFHANIDRLWAMWQNAVGYQWRLDSDLIYGTETMHIKIIKNCEPWAGNSGVRPWTCPDNKQRIKNSKHRSIVVPPLYDSITLQQTDKLITQCVE